MKKLLVFTALIEAIAGAALMAAPAPAVSLLVGAALDTASGLVVARVAGGALLALGLACWLARDGGQDRGARVIVAAMLLYNVAVAAVLVHAGLGLKLSGIGLWPAVVLHLALAVGASSASGHEGAVGERGLARVGDHLIFTVRVENENGLRPLLKMTLSSVILAWSLPPLCAQDLAPRAYVVTPVHWNAITLSDAFNDGDILLEGAAPVTGGTGKGHVPALSLYHASSVFGRSANVVASLPYGVMNFHGTVAGAEASAYRSGLLDLVFRFSVNLKGAPAMPLGEYGKWHQKTLLGWSFKVVAPTGQYDPTKLINWGANRWAFRPELGLSRRFGAIGFSTPTGGCGSTPPTPSTSRTTP